MREIEAPQGPTEPEVFSNFRSWLVNHGIQDHVSRQLADSIRNFYPVCTAYFPEEIQIGISAKTVEPPDNWTINPHIVPTNPFSADLVDPIRKAVEFALQEHLNPVPHPRPEVKVCLQEPCPQGKNPVAYLQDYAGEQGEEYIGLFGIEEWLGYDPRSLTPEESNRLHDKALEILRREYPPEETLRMLRLQLELSEEQAAALEYLRDFVKEMKNRRST